MGRRKRRLPLAPSTSSTSDQEQATCSNNTHTESSSSSVYDKNSAPTGIIIEINAKPSTSTQTHAVSGDNNKPPPPPPHAFTAWVAMGDKNKFINVNIKMLDILQQMGEAISGYLEDPNLSQERTASSSQLLNDLQNKLDVVKICVKYNSLMAVGRLDLFKRY